MTTLDTILALLSSYKYWAMLGVLILCGLGLPLPEEATLLASGLAVGWKEANFWLSSAACLAGILIGDTIVFSVGRYWGRLFLASKPMRWLLPPRRQVKVQRLFAKHGNKAVFIARFFAGVRLGVYAYAGQHGMKWTRFILLDLLGALISAPTSIWIGKFAAERLADPEDAKELAQYIVQRGEHWLYIALVVLILLCVAHWLWNRRRDRRTLGREAPRGGESRLPAATNATGSAGGSRDSP